MRKGSIRNTRHMSKREVLAELSKTDKKLRSSLPLCLWKGSEHINRRIQRMKVGPAARHKIARMNWQLALLFYRKELRRKL